MALFTCAAKLDPGALGASSARAKAVHHAVGISNISWHKVFPLPSLSPYTHISKKGYGIVEFNVPLDTL